MPALAVGDNSTGYKGVRPVMAMGLHNGTYAAQRSAHGQIFPLGVFNTPVEAAIAYAKHAAEYKHVQVEAEAGDEEANDEAALQVEGYVAILGATCPQGTPDCIGCLWRRARGPNGRRERLSRIGMTSTYRHTAILLRHRRRRLRTHSSRRRSGKVLPLGAVLEGMGSNGSHARAAPNGARWIRGQSTLSI